MSRKAMILTLAILALLGALPSHAGETMTPAPVPLGLTAPAPQKAGCIPDLDRLLQAKPAAPAQGEVCSAASLESAALPLLPLAQSVIRTCLCSCGTPCTKDSQCGPGGHCTTGVTCC